LTRTAAAIQPIPVVNFRTYASVPTFRHRSDGTGFRLGRFGSVRAEVRGQALIYFKST
jgi:hypothetical protein